MSSLQMEYNSSREDLIMPEYGRNVQKLIDYAKTIEDRNTKQAFVEMVVELMMQMNTQNKNLEDYREKLWKHVFRIAGYELENVIPPLDEVPTDETYLKKPEGINYPKSDTRFRHYGNNVHRLIIKAIEMEDGPKKQGFIETIAYYMKMAYRTWNKEHYVSDDLIKSDLFSLSGGKLKFPEEQPIEKLANSSSRRRKRPATSSSNSNSGGKSRGRSWKRK